MHVDRDVHGPPGLHLHTPRISVYPRESTASMARVHGRMCRCRGCERGSRPQVIIERRPLDSTVNLMATKEGGSSTVSLGDVAESISREQVTHDRTNH